MPPKTLPLDGESLSIADVVAVAHAQPGDYLFHLTPEAQRRVAQARQAVEDFVAQGRVVYGITTGFGAFCNRVIDPDQTAQLQRNIVMSHAVGVGRPLETAVVRAMMLIRANTLAKGHSGCRQAVIDLLLRLLERGVHPVIPRQGSLGASGDLAPLAHIALVLIGLGEAEVGGRILPGAVALAEAGLAPLELQAKEGLALTNGTTLMAALGALAVVEAENVATVADIAGCLSLEALHGTPAAFDPRLQAVRPHPRAVECAAGLRRLLQGSTFVRDVSLAAMVSGDGGISEPQDPYTLRCIPQVHGACH